MTLTDIAFFVIKVRCWVVWDCNSRLGTLSHGRDFEPPRHKCKDMLITLRFYSQKPYFATALPVGSQSSR